MKYIFIALNCATIDSLTTALTLSAFDEEAAQSDIVNAVA